MQADQGAQEIVDVHRPPMHKLDADSVRKIGATEVISSPVAVLKELVENALDAGASRVQVKIDDCGLNLVEVADNGVGIPASSMPMIAQHHCTSKVTSVADLAEGKVETYGFRGEALASIAVVAGQMTLATCCPGEPTGRRYVFDIASHKFIPAKPPVVAMQSGTIMTVSKLFERFPVRRDYYAKSKARQRSELLNQFKHNMAALSLCKTSCRLSLKLVNCGSNTNQYSWETAPGCTVPTLLALIGGPLVSASDFHYLKCENVLPEHSAELFLPAGKMTPEKMSMLFKSNHENCFICVNGRSVEDKELASALKTAYNETNLYIQTKNYPLACLKLTAPLKLIDANVEVSKQRVYFGAGKDALMEGLRDAVVQFLMKEAGLNESQLLEDVRAVVNTPRSRVRLNEFASPDVPQRANIEENDEEVLDDAVTGRSRPKRRRRLEDEDLGEPIRALSTNPEPTNAPDKRRDVLSPILPSAEETIIVASENSPPKIKTNSSSFNMAEWSRGTALINSSDSRSEHPVAIIPPRDTSSIIGSNYQRGSKVTPTEDGLEVEDIQTERQRPSQPIPEISQGGWAASLAKLYSNYKTNDRDEVPSAMAVESQNEPENTTDDRLTLRLAKSRLKRHEKALKKRPVIPDEVLELHQTRPCYDEAKSGKIGTNGWLVKLNRFMNSRNNNNTKLSEGHRVLGRVSLNSSVQMLLLTLGAEIPAPSADWLQKNLVWCSQRRLAESALFTSMMASVQLPKRSLGHTFSLSRYLTVEQLNFLVHLPSKKQSNPPLYLILTDQRLVANGFKLRLYTSSDQMSLSRSLDAVNELSKSTNANYVEVEQAPELPEPFNRSTPDQLGPLVREIVEAMMGDPTNTSKPSLSNCRPKHFVEYFRSEVDRLLTVSIQQNNAIDEDGLLSSKDDEYLGHLLKISNYSIETLSELKCPHGKPIFCHL